MNTQTPGTLYRLATLAVLLAVSGALTLGYLGRLHPAFDSFSHFRLHLAAALALCVPALVFLRFRPEALFALALAVLATFQTVGLPFTRQPAAQADGSGPVYRLLHINLLHDNPSPEAALSLIGRLRPDIVTLNEVSAEWRQKLALIEAAYPHRLVCQDPEHTGGTAILSRRPFDESFEPYCADAASFAHARLDVGGRTLDVVSVHLSWPWPFHQPSQLQRLTPLLGAVGDTAIIAGDLNAAPWSRAAQRVASDSGAQLLRGIGPTWLDRRLPDWLRALAGLPIDNIMVRGGVLPASAGTVEGVGSDHLPVLLEFTLLPQERPAEVLRASL